MVRRGRGRGPNSQRRQAVALRQRINAEHRRNDGAKLVPPLTPPQFVKLPWNSYTFSASYGTGEQLSNEAQIRVYDVRNSIVTKMGLNGAPGTVLLKIQSAMVWQVATGNGLAEPNMRCWFYEIDPDASTYTFRSEQGDHGTLNRPARCGYQWPLRDSKQVLSSANDNHVLLRFKTVSNENMGNFTVRVKVLWLCSDQAQPVAVDRDSEAIVNGMQLVKL